MDEAGPMHIGIGEAEEWIGVIGEEIGCHDGVGARLNSFVTQAADRRPRLDSPNRGSQTRRLKNCTARSCRSAALRLLNVPRFRRRPVRGSFFFEYRRYSPVDSLRIMVHLPAIFVAQFGPAPRRPLGHREMEPAPGES